MYENISKLLKDREQRTLTTENILNKISDYQIFSYYLGSNFTINKVFSSPFRTDRTPSFCIFRTSEGNLMFKDLARGDTGDCFTFAGKILGIFNFTRLLVQINIDFKLNLIHNIESYIPKVVKGVDFFEQKEIVNKINDIQIKTRPFNSQDLEYWQDYGVDEILLKYFNVFATEYTYYNNNLWSVHSKYNPCYAYIFRDDEGNYGYKLYRPLEKDKKKKWMSNVNPESMLQGISNLTKSNKILIITKSLKDVMVLRTLGYHSIAVQGESMIINESLMDILKTRFEKIYLLFDFDLGGIKGAKRFRKKYPFIYITFLQNLKTRNNGCKDISDARKILGYVASKELLINSLQLAKNKWQMK